MRFLGSWKVLALGGALATLLAFGTSSAIAVNFHGIAFAKTCVDPTTVGAPLECRFQIFNFDTGNNSEVIFSLTDTVNSSGGSVPSGELLPSLQLSVSPTSGANKPVCTGPSVSGDGVATPYTGATSCVLPALGSTITTANFTHYTVQAADYALPNHRLTDQGLLGWKDNCDKDPGGCNSGNQTATAPGSSRVRFAPSLATSVNGNATSVIEVGGSAHDTATLTGMSPDAGGTVTYTLYTDNSCGSTAAGQPSPATVTVTNGSVPNSGSVTFSGPGRFWWAASYSGDANNLPASSGCAAEPLAVVDANIQITPATAVNPIGTNHTLIGHVNVNDGTGYTSAPNGTVIDFEKLSGPGAFVGGVNTCTVTNGLGSCAVQITSAAAGLTTVRAKTTVTVLGLQLHRETGDGKPGDSADAQKQWVGAKITIAPDATNEVGTPHTFTVTVSRDPGGGYEPATGSHVDFTLTNSNGASFTLDAVASTCDDAGANVDSLGRCLIVINSSTPGQVRAHASSVVSIPGDGTVTVQTDGQGDNSGDAVKTYVDAYITITPLTDTNAVNTTHTFTAQVFVNAGLGAGYVAPPNGTPVTFAYVGAHVGSFSAGNTCTTTGGACSVDTSSSATGTDTMSASTTVSVGGLSLTRTTGTSAPGHANGPNAEKKWVNANIQISPATDTNAIDTNHVLTITVNALNGTLDAGTHTATAEIVSGPGSFVGSPSCTYAGGGTTASCTVTITSSSTGTTVVKASADILVDGQSIHRETNTAANTAAGGSGNAQKKWVNANIRITPATAVNAVSENHVLTIRVNALNGFLDPGTHQATASIVSGPGSFVGSPTCDYTVVGATETTAACTVTITSATVGLTEIQATSNILVDGQSITRTTETPANTAAGGSDNAEKKWVNAYIEITPATAVNPVGTNHVLTITVHSVNGTLGDGTATATILPGGVGSFVGSSACNYTGGGMAASCTVTITSNTSGTSVVQASSNIPVDSQLITRTTGTQTNTDAGGSGNAQKQWVKARITITPNDVNEINDPHTFTVTVQRDLGGGYEPAPPLHVTYTLTSEFGVTLTEDLASSTCDDAGNNINAAGQCTIVVNSSTPGRVTASASANVPVSGSTVLVTTDGTGDNSGPATKRWVDANIQITPSGTNEVGTNHVFTVHVNVNAGLGAGYVNAPDGTSIVLAKASGPGSFTTANPCTTSGGTGSCTVTLSSSATGVTIVNASTSVVVGGVTLNRTTNGAAGNSGPANKTWVDASIGITPQNATNPVSTQHTFTITIKRDNGLGGGLQPLQGVALANSASSPPANRFTFVNSNGATATLVNQTCSNPGTNASGECTVTVTSPTGGTTKLFAYVTLSIAGQTGSATVSRDADSATATGHGPTGTDEATKLWEPPVTALPCPAGLFLAGAGTGPSNPDGDLRIAYDQFPAPNDNSYGVNAAGWGGPGKHKFSSLTGSDHAGFQVIRPAGTVALSFAVDYISSKSGTPSGYGSLGPFGGDGKILTQSSPALTAAGIDYDTSLSRNLNNTGYFVGGVQQSGHQTATNGANLLLDSPPVTGVNPGDSPSIVNNRPNDGGQYEFKTPNPWTPLYSNPEYDAMDLSGSLDFGEGPIPITSLVARDVKGWNFHDTFFVTLKRAYLTSIGFEFGNWEFAQQGQCSARGANAKWCVTPNDSVLHNSPAKPCPVKPISASDIQITKYEPKDQQVKITILNNHEFSPTFITDILNLTWPQANGNLIQVKLDGDTVWNGSIPWSAGGVANLATVPTWNADPNKRKIDKHTSDVLAFIFQNKPVATPLTSGYTATVRFDDSFNIQVLPQP